MQRNLFILKQHCQEYHSGLNKVADLSIANQDMDEVAKYNTSIAGWNQIIANNEETKAGQLPYAIFL